MLKGKISGILCKHEFIGMLCFKTVIGIGINVGQMTFKNVKDNTPVSLKRLGETVKKDEIIKTLEEKLSQFLNVPREIIFKTWVDELDILEKEILVKGTDGSWKVSEIMEDGRLKIFKKNEQRIIDNGDSIRY